MGIVEKKEPVMLMAEIEWVNGKKDIVELLGNEMYPIESWYPENIIKELDLQKPIYEELSKWGYFGNNNKWDKFN